jgi:phosphonatase-like hydrolase
MIKMIVFDMAGTTVNEDNLVYKILQQAINEAGFNFTLGQVLEEGAGKEKLQAIRSVLLLAGIEDEPLALKIFERFLPLLETAYSTHTIEEQPGAGVLFEELHRRNIKVVLNTGYDRKTAQKLLNNLGWKTGHQIDGLVTASDVPNGRPHPDMIILAMQHQNVTDAADVIKIGDSVTDIEEGHRAECRYSIGITTGAQTREQLSNATPDFIIDSLQEIIPILDKVKDAKTY